MIAVPELPPVDIYRLPFIVPLGHLVLNAARVDNALIEFVASLHPDGPQTTTEQVAHRLRNWTDDTKKFVLDAIDSVADAIFAEDARGLIGRYENLRELRHRAIHDAVEIGIFGDPSTGYEVRPLQEGYVRRKDHTSHRLVGIGPDGIAVIAYEFYDLAADIEMLSHRTRE